MSLAPQDANEEVRRLQACLNDLIGTLALPALWAVRGPAEIVATLLDGAIRTGGLDFACVMLGRPMEGVAPLTVRPAAAAALVDFVSENMARWVKHDVPDMRLAVASPIGKVSIAFCTLGLRDGLGVLAAGSRRADFPTRIDSLLLQVAANQAAIGLHEVRRLAEFERGEATEADRAQLALIVENSDDFIGVATLEGHALYVNRAGQALVGMEAHEVRATHVAEFVVARERERVRKVVWPAVLRTGRWEGEVMFRHMRTDALIPMHTHAFLMTDGPSGRPTAVATVSRDITQRKLAETESGALKDALAAELAEMRRLHQLSTRLHSEAGLQALLGEALEATIAVQGAERGSVRLYDPRTRTYELAAHRGHRPDYLETYHSASADELPYAKDLAAGKLVVIADTMADERMKPWREWAAATGVRAVQITPLLTRDRELIGLLATHFPHPHQPSDHQLRFTELYARQAADMIERSRVQSALRRSESYLAQGERLSHTGSWSVNARTGEMFWSQEHYRIFGLARGTPLVREEAVAMIHEDDRPATVAAWERAVAAHGPYEGEFRVVRPDGGVRCVHSIGYPLFDGAGNVAEWVGTIIDITERKIAAEAVRTARNELAHVARVTTMGELTASIAHEVNQPLAAVVANAHACVHWLAAEPPNMHEAAAAAQRIIRDANRAGEVIAHIRTFLTRGTQSKAPLRIEDVIRDVVGIVEPEARAKGVLLQTSLEEDLPAIHGNAVQLQQVVLNLMVNAIEAMGSDGETRELSIGARRSSQDEVGVWVRDSGPGLDPQQLEEVFKIFYTTKPQGMGLGLSISRSIVEAHGGRLSAQRNAGPGQTFEFILPLPGAGAS